MTEAWLRGPVDGVPDALMPAAHCLLDAMDDLERAAAPLTVAQLWLRPGGAASVGFHLRHVRGSLDRLLTYAEGRSLSRSQLAEIERESDPGDRPRTATEVLAALRVAVTDALDVYRATPADALPAARSVGRAGLPSTVQGLMFHAAEHARRHAGQAVATSMIIRGLGLQGSPVGAKHDPDKWDGFLIRYHEELDGRPDVVTDLARASEAEVAEAVRLACVEAALQAYEDAGIAGLCIEGRREVAVDAVRNVDLTAVVAGARRRSGDERSQSAVDPVNADR